MASQEVSAYVSDYWVLRYLYGQTRSPATKVLRFVPLFVLPAILIAVSAVDGVLFLEGDAVGMLEDYLFLCGSFVAFPLLIYILHVVIRRFDYLLTDLPTFADIPNDELEALREEFRGLATRTGSLRAVTAGRWLFGLIALSSSIFSICRRSDGWDALAHPVELALVVVHMILNVLIVGTPMLAKYMTMVWVQIKLMRRLTQKEGVIVVRPLAPDGAGGLRALGRLALAYTYFLFPLTLLGVATYITFGRLTPGTVLGMVFFFPFCGVVFFGPLGTVHRIMRKGKQDLLDRLSTKARDVGERLLDAIESDGSGELIASDREVMDALDNMYEKASKMPVWPFDVGTLARFLIVALGPLLIIMVEIAITFLFSLFVKM